ncbi:hypothetical protein [Persicitalea sp.]|uniref:hypothetical protein n=1 Tax=Persicitalea sp. TaxID=3100273 RepID=UPI0035939391
MTLNFFKTHKRTSIYDEDDFSELQNVIGSLEQIVVLPNVWTEVDNLLNGFSGNYKYSYISIFADLIELTTETYISSDKAISKYEFYHLGLTDSLILEKASTCELLITSDSRLFDYASANGIQVYDLVKAKNAKLK